jgi:hypothetical protein
MNYVFDNWVVILTYGCLSLMCLIIAVVIIRLVMFNVVMMRCSSEDTYAIADRVYHLENKMAISIPKLNALAERVVILEQNVTPDNEH